MIPYPKAPDFLHMLNSNDHYNLYTNKQVLNNLVALNQKQKTIYIYIL